MKEVWEYKKLGEVTSFQNGFAFKSSLFRKDGLPIVRISSIQDEKIMEDDLVSFYPSDYDVNFDNYKILPNDILIAMSGGTTGKLGINKSNKVFYQNQRVGVIRENAEILNHLFLFYYLHTKSEESLKIAAGAAQPNLSTAQIKEFIIPLPSLEEQQSIVEYLDSAFAKIDAMKANAEKALNEAKALFQASLKEMLEPKEGWEEDILSNCCIKAKNIKWEKDTPSHKYIDLSSVDRETSKILNTIIVSPKDAPSRAKQIVIKGDIIFATTRPTLRRVALISEKFDGEICSTGFCVLRPKKHIISKWIFYLLKADKFYNYIEPLQSGANYPAVTDSAVKGYVIPMPPINEQHNIVATLDSLKSKVDRLQENYDKISQECDALKQAILRQVFE